MKILTLGPNGTYSSIASKKAFPKAQIEFADTVSHVFDEFKKNKYDALVAPVENTIYGTERETFDNLYESNLKIYNSIDLEIHHCLASQDKNFKIIASHIQALSQCKNFLNKNYSKIKLFKTSSTAEAALLAQKNSDYACITNEETAKKYNLKIIHKNIQDFKNNKTKFWIISKKYNPKKQKFTSIVIKPNTDCAGLLLKLLMPFNYLNINLTRLESRPAKGENGKYLFYIDFEGDFRDQKSVELLKILKTGEVVEELKVF